MDKAIASFAVFFLFIMRCLVPIVLLLGVSYILKKLGLIQEPPSPPAEYTNNDNNNDQVNSSEGGMING